MKWLKKTEQKELTPKEKFQYRITLLGTMNFALGVVIVAFTQMIHDIVFGGLFHKIINIFGSNIPVGALSMSFVSILVTIITYMILLFDFNVYTKGIEWIKIKGEKIEVKTQS